MCTTCESIKTTPSDDERLQNTMLNIGVSAFIGVLIQLVFLVVLMFLDLYGIKFQFHEHVVTTFWWIFGILMFTYVTMVAIWGRSDPY